jgi:hypothetical protein
VLTCEICGEVLRGEAEVTKVVNTGTTTYTAEFNDLQDTLTVKNQYTVTYQGAGQTKYWGDIVTLNAGQNSKWFTMVDETQVVLSYGQTYTFAVTEDITVYSVADSTSSQAVASSTMVAQDGNKAIFHAKWSLPSNAQVKSVTIYRAFNQGGTLLGNPATDNERQLLGGTPFNVDMKVLSGDYTFTITNIGQSDYPTKSHLWQNAQLWIVYNVPGNDQDLELHTPVGLGVSQVQVW